VESITHQLPARIPYDACPLCGGQEAVSLGTFDCRGHALYQPALPPTMRWVRCRACGHVFTDGYFNDAALQVLFSTSHPGQTPGHDVAAGRAVSARIVEAVSERRPPPPAGRWLDVGFGGGALLFTAAEYGYDVVGLDLRQKNVLLLRELGLSAHCQDLLSFTSDQPFDVVSMADVLEHMPQPRLALGRVHDLLADGGLLFVSMPNLDCFLWRVLDQNRQNPYWAEIEHYHNFGRARLYDLLRACGFAPLRYGISQRYVACMEVIARKEARP
jgi:SAM-dependent methyltransferase